MADTKISAAADAGALVATDKLPLARSGSATAYAATAAEIAAYANGTYAPSYAVTTPLMDGVGAGGTATTVSRGDHRHPTDTTLYPASNPAGYQTAADVTISLAPYAPLASPPLTGTPTAPTVTPAGDSTTKLATTAFVQAALGAAGAGVTSWNARTGAVVMTLADVTGIGGAPIASPTFTGTPAVPTATAGTATTQAASTAFVTNAVTASTGGVSTFNTRSGAVTLTNADVTTVLPASSTTPAMDGTAAIGTGATWARADHIHPVDSSRYAASNPSGYQTAANVTTSLALYAPLASPTFTGNPTAPTPAPGDKDTSIATTAFVAAATAPALNDVGRNLLHNARFRVNQRGPGPWSGNAYTTDRWVLGSALDSDTISLLAGTDTVRAQIGDEEVDTFLSNAFTGNAGAGAFSFIAQRIENVRRLAGKTVTVSFWANASSLSLKLGVSLDQSFGTGGSPSAGVFGTGQAVTLASAPFTRYSLTFTVPSGAGKTLGSNDDSYTALNVWYSSGSNTAGRSGLGVQSGTVNLWGVQLEVGSVATALEKLDIADDYAKCQRFYQTAFLAGFASMTAGGNYLISTALPVQMRVTAGVAITDQTGSANVGAISVSTDTGRQVQAYATATTTGQTQLVVQVALSAEL